ncbi:blast:NAD-dependent protein deacetylase Sirt6 [Drosophila guanche]|nr:blast:NAD-dependent protein deacetylase Sirt6 [Drosophila guanche]
MALRALVEAGYVQYIVSQNIDGLHLRSGLNRRYISELHGNIFIEQCHTCGRQFVRSTSVESVGQKSLGIRCRLTASDVGRACRSGSLHDNVLDWEHDLPPKDLDMAIMHSTMADLNITLGTTLQIVPSGNLPLKNRKGGGKLVICNLQPTKHVRHLQILLLTQFNMNTFILQDSKANLVISSYVDAILSKVCKCLGVEISEYTESSDPTTHSSLVEWTIPLNHVNTIKSQFRAHLKETVGCSPKRKKARGAVNAPASSKINN